MWVSWHNCSSVSDFRFRMLLLGSTERERERERENYAEKGGNPFLHMLREWTLT